MTTVLKNLEAAQQDRNERYRKEKRELIATLETEENRRTMETEDIRSMSLVYITKIKRLQAQIKSLESTLVDSD